MCHRLGLKSGLGCFPERKKPPPEGGGLEEEK
jgi:hypothetical protein